MMSTRECYRRIALFKGYCFYQEKKKDILLDLRQAP